MRFLTGTYLIFSLLILFSSCAYKQDQLLFEQKNAMPDTILQKAVGIDNYKIKPQDILQIRNLQSISSISGDASSTSGPSGTQGQTFQVEEDGNIALPVIGHVQVVGLTRVEAANKIEDLYQKNLLKNPIIEVKIVNLKVTMLGEVKSQGNYPLVKDKTSLVEMIGEAGGITDRANEKDVRIIRGTQQNPEVIQVDLGNIKSINDPQNILQNGDIVYIAQNRRAIRSDKLIDFSTIIQPLLIVINTALIIFTLARQ
jgi:polysaccharide export outer membrane protein